MQDEVKLFRKRPVVIEAMQFIADSKQELLPCPFCGKNPEVTTRDVEPQGDTWYGRKYETFVLCDCGACLFEDCFHEGFGSPERAIAAWNARPSDPLTAELVEALNAVLELLPGHNPQHPDMLEFDECPKDHVDCCGYCEVIHSARAALAKVRNIQAAKEAK